jgi:hypothetical protein
MADEKTDLRYKDEGEDVGEDVEAHRYVSEEPGDDEAEKTKTKMKTKTRTSEDIGDDFEGRAKY